MKLIFIEWTDAASLNGWCEGDDAGGLLLIRSVGWLIEETKDYIAISTGYVVDEANRKFADPFTIPKACIKKRRYIKH